MNALGMPLEGKSTYFSLDVLWFLEIYGHRAYHLPVKD